MHKVSYRLHEATKVCQDLTNAYVLSPEVQELVEKDLFAGMSKDDIKRYCTKKISLMRMKIISECIKKDASDDVINRLSSSKDKDESTLELIYTMLQENIDVGTIDSMAPDHDRLLNCLDRFRQGLSLVSDEEDIEKINEANSEGIDKDSYANAETGSQENNKSDSTKDNDNSHETDKNSSSKEKTGFHETDNTGSEKEKTVSEKKEVGSTIADEANTENINKISGLSKEDVQELIKGFGSELIEGISAVIKNQESVEAGIRKEFEKKIDDLSEQLEQTTRSFEDKLKQTEDRTKQIEERTKQTEKSIIQEEVRAKQEDNKTNDITYNSISNTNSDVANISANDNSKVETVGEFDSESDSSGTSKVIQFTNRNGSQLMTSAVEFSRRKNSGITALAAALGCKKRSRKSMMKMAITGELSKEQLVHIVEAIRRGLTEEQLCQLIENKVPADKMPQIIEIAVLENKMGYSA